MKFKNVIPTGRQGFAQIPLMIGLLLMAVAIPAVTSLVQQNQENRGKAMETGDGCNDVTSPCGKGYKCINKVCKWVGVPAAPTSAISTPKPADPKNTTAPKATAVPTLKTGLCTSLVCSSGQTKEISGAGYCYCSPVPTNGPITWINTPTPLRGQCANPGYHVCSGNVSTYCSVDRVWQPTTSTLCPYGCSSDGKCKPVPTAIPTIGVIQPTPKSGECNVTAGFHCDGGVSSFCNQVNDVKVWDPIMHDVCGYGCDSATGRCKPAPTKIPAPTDRPMPSATSCTVPGYHCMNGDSYFCNSNGGVLSDERSEDCHGCGCTGKGICTPCSGSPTVVLSTPITTKVPTLTVTSTACAKNGDSCYVGKGCCTGLYCASSRKCAPYITSTPVSTITSGPGGGNGGGGGNPVATATTKPANTSVPSGSSCTQCPTAMKCYVNGTEYKWFAEGYPMQGFTKVDSTKA